jgi:hypothetical protein
MEYYLVKKCNYGCCWHISQKENTLHDPSPFPLMFARFWKDDTQGTFGVLENLMSCFYGAIVGKHNCQNVQIV